MTLPPLAFDHPRFEPVRSLSTGPHGDVLLALDKRSGSYVALKCLRREQVGADGLAEREVLNRVMASGHPHIVALHEVFLTEDHLCLALELAAGGTLADRIPAGKGMPEDEARWVFQQVIFALEYLHRLGMAARDLKLENVLVDAQGSAPGRPIVKLGDFNLSTMSRRPATASLVSEAGRPCYFAPEMLTTRGEYYAKKADIWSAGILLYLMLSGCCPFQRARDSTLAPQERLLALLKRMSAGEYHMPSWLSPDAQDLLTVMLVPDPCKRPSAQDILHHPWLAAGGLQPAAVLRCNDAFFAKSLSSPLSPEVVREVRSIFREATMRPDTPTSSQVLTCIPEGDGVEGL